MCALESWKTRELKTDYLQGRRRTTWDLRERESSPEKSVKRPWAQTLAKWHVHSKNQWTMKLVVVAWVAWNHKDKIISICQLQKL